VVGPTMMTAEHEVNTHVLDGEPLTCLMGKLRAPVEALSLPPVRAQSFLREFGNLCGMFSE
jgi:hypothetical protein